MDQHAPHCARAQNVARSRHCRAELELTVELHPRAHGSPIQASHELFSPHADAPRPNPFPLEPPASRRRGPARPRARRRSNLTVELHRPPLHCPNKSHQKLPLVALKLTGPASPLLPRRSAIAATSAPPRGAQLRPPQPQPKPPRGSAQAPQRFPQHSPRRRRATSPESVAVAPPLFLSRRRRTYLRTRNLYPRSKLQK